MKKLPKLYIKLIVINFCRCPTLAYMAAMYTGMFYHFSFKGFTENLCFFNSPVESNCAKTFTNPIGQKDV